jgi:5-methylcytosine-specific restriction endonuclease McrA
VSPLWHRYSDEDYFTNLLDIWTYYGRQPKSWEMDELPSKICRHSYARKYGSWRKALESFVSRMNEDAPNKKEVVQDKLGGSPAVRVLKERPLIETVLSEDKRGLGLGLRYKVLVRDQFKCVKCGASPATKHNCRLHVDHKDPFSKGGKTTEGNLQTLCERCNLGKGNRHRE